MISSIKESKNIFVSLLNTWISSSIIFFSQTELSLPRSPSPPQDVPLADAQLRSMASHWVRILSRPVPVAARW